MLTYAKYAPLITTAAILKIAYIINICGKISYEKAVVHQDDRFFCVGVKCFVLRDLLVLKQMISFVEINPK